MSKNEKDWDEIEQNYLEMREQDLEQVDMPELWSRIEERLDQSQSEEESEKEKKTKRTGRKAAVLGTLAAAAVLVIVSWSVMNAGNSLKNDSTASMDFCDLADSESSQSSQQNMLEQSKNKESASEQEETTEINIQDTEDSESKSSAGRYDAISQNEMECGKESMSDRSTSAGEDKEGEPILLCIEKENGFYEFSVNLEKYDLQLMEISVKKEEDVFLIAYSEFSTSAREVLQEKISDISSYKFYINSEGVLYMKKDDQYYHIQIDER